MTVALHSFYVQLLLINLFPVLIGKFDWQSNFQPRFAGTRPYNAQTGGKHDFQEMTVVLHSFYVQLLLINLFPVLIGKFDW